MPTGARSSTFAHTTCTSSITRSPCDASLSLQELKPRPFSTPARPDWIPYRTSYYRRQWGFCLSHSALQPLQPGRYEVVVDSTLAPGSLTYAECVLPGRARHEVLFFTHICHPSLANDNTSGMAIATALAAWLARTATPLQLPLCVCARDHWLAVLAAKNQSRLRRVRHGLVLGPVGRPGAADLQVQPSRQLRH